MALKKRNFANLPNPHDLELVERGRGKVFEIASRLVSGQLTHLEGARLILAQQAICAVEQDDPDFLAFRIIESETDHLPIGWERRNWAGDALLRLQPEIEAAERRASGPARTAAESLLSRFGPAGS